MKIFAWSLAAAMLLAGILTSGCDTESADSQVKIYPESVTIKKWQSVEFTASGGYEYTWSLEGGKETWGILSARTGNKTVYTSLYDPGTNDVRRLVLQVTSTIPGNTSTSSAPDTWTAEAYIYHM